jgi:hypothetical protein
MDERLREVAAHLVLVGVVFLAEQLWWAAGSARAFVPGAGFDVVVLLVLGEGDKKAAQQEGALGVAEGARVVAVSVGVAVVGEVVEVGVQRGESAGIVGGDGATQAREEQGGVDGRVVG